MSLSWESKLTPREVAAYKQFFNAAAKSQPSVVSGMEAVEFFAKSGLPNDILSQIWETADERNLGYLTPDTFAIALKLIACAQHNIKAKEPLFSTVTPIPAIQGVQVINSSTSTSISAQEKKKYQAIYNSQSPTPNGIPAETAKNLFAKSRLPNDQLAQIWHLADIRKCGFLDETEFVVAMHYIAKLMDKSLTSLPSILPPDVYLAAASPDNTNALASSPLLQSRAKKIDSIGNMAFAPAYHQQHDWDIAAHEKAQYDVFFAKLDKKHTGVVQGADAVEFFKNSKLPKTELARIWDLADIGSTGTLNANEFAIAMHLIHKRLIGDMLPVVLPPSLMPPPTPTSPTCSPMNTASVSLRSMSAPSSHKVAPAQSSSVNEDLLGEFENESLVEETSKVNLLKNQILSSKKSTIATEAQHKKAVQSLGFLREKKQDLQSQVDNLKKQTETESSTLNSLKADLETEQPTWAAAQSDLEAAEAKLKEIQQQSAQAKQELEDGQLENEELRRTVHRVQMESLRLEKELDALHTENKRKRDEAAAAAAAAEQKAQEDARKAKEKRLKDEARQVEEARIAKEKEEARKSEEARLVEESRLKEEARLMKESRLKEEARLMEESRLKEEARLMEESRLKEEARLMEESRLKEEARLADEARKVAEKNQQQQREARLIEEAKENEAARLVAANKAEEDEKTRLANEESARLQRKENELLEVKKKKKKETMDAKSLASASNATCGYNDGAGTTLSNNKESEQDETESTDDFFDAVDAIPKNASEHEFVMIDHPTKPNDVGVTAACHVSIDDAAETTDQQVKEEAPVTEANKPVNAEVTKNPFMEGMSPFVAIFGLDQGQQQQGQEQQGQEQQGQGQQHQQQQDVEEDEPVMVSSRSGSEISDPVTAGSSSVAPPPSPPPPEPSSTPTVSSVGHAKKPRALSPQPPPPPPPPPPPSHRFITTRLPENVGKLDSDDHDEFDAYFSDPTFASNQDAASSGIRHASLVPIENQHVVSTDMPPVAAVMRAAAPIGSNDSSKGSDQRDRPDDGKHEKKKNIVSWAKSLGRSRDKKNKNKKHVGSASSLSGPPPDDAQNLTYDSDTIQGSHIAELVNMGFDAASALEALNRYDQDLGKATNFLLDQAL